MSLSRSLTRSLARPLSTPITLPEGVGVAYETEALALFARFTTPPTTARKNTINTAIKALKTAGVWTKLDALYVLAAADAQAAQRNWIADAYNLTPQNSPTFVADVGYTGNGTSSYLDTGFNPTTAVSPKFTQNSASMGAWCVTDVNEDRSEIGNSNSQVGARRSATLVLRTRPNVASTNNGCVVTDSLGLSAWSRSSSTAVKYYKNGSMGLSESRPSAALTNENFTVLAAEAAASRSTKTVSLAFFGQSLSDEEQAALYAAFA